MNILKTASSIAGTYQSQNKLREKYVLYRKF